MSEEPIFWAGRLPRQQAEAVAPAEDPEYAAAVARACESAGVAVQRYVAASGQYGSWLLELGSGSEARRLIWNGKSGRLSLDRQQPAGGWRELAAEELDARDLESLASAMQRLLA